MIRKRRLAVDDDHIGVANEVVLKLDPHVANVDLGFMPVHPAAECDRGVRSENIMPAVRARASDGSTVNKVVSGGRSSFRGEVIVHRGLFCGLSKYFFVHVYSWVVFTALNSKERALEPGPANAWVNGCWK